MARSLARTGAAVIFADSDGETATAEAKASSNHGGWARAVTCDITRRSDCERAVAAARETFGGLHILVNNAALGPSHVELSRHTKSLAGLTSSSAAMAPFREKQ